MHCNSTDISLELVEGGDSEQGNKIAGGSAGSSWLGLAGTAEIS